MVCNFVKWDVNWPQRFLETPAIFFLNNQLRTGVWRHVAHGDCTPAAAVLNFKYCCCFVSCILQVSEAVILIATLSH